jgi:hypothetical protein
MKQKMLICSSASAAPPPPYQFIRRLGELVRISGEGDVFEVLELQKMYAEMVKYISIYGRWRPPENSLSGSRKMSNLWLRSRMIEAGPRPTISRGTVET